MNILDQLDKAERTPTAMFEKVPTPAPDAQEQPAQDGARVLDIGVKAENTPFLNSADNASARNAFNGGANNATQGGANMFQPQAGGVKLGDAVGGKTATELLNVLFPSLIVFAVSNIGYHIDKRMIELTPDEKKIVAPAFQDYLNTININFNNPLYNLLFVLGGIYAAKAIDVIPNLQKKKPAVKQPANASQQQRATSSGMSAADALIERTAKQRKKGKKEAAQFLLKQKEIKWNGSKFEMA